MKFGIMVLDGPYQHQAADSAYQFIRAARAKGHEIIGIFLFTDGVNIANKFIKPPGERNIAQRFDELAQEGIEVVACSACAKFRGMRPDVKMENIKLSGLGSLAGFLEKADRFITFSD